MPCGSRAEVLALVEAVADPQCPLDAGDLDGLGLDLEALRRPHGEVGAWAVARFEAAPPALRVASAWFTIRAEIRNGGVDQLAWNQLARLPALIEGLHHVGAHGLATLLAELGEGVHRSSDEPDAVAEFLAFRRRVGGPWCTDEGGDPIEEVAEALVAHARAHPEEFVCEPVDERTATDADPPRRALVRRRPDGRLEVALQDFRRYEHPSTLAASGGGYWVELPVPPITFGGDELAAARAHAIALVG